MLSKINIKHGDTDKKDEGGRMMDEKSKSNKGWLTIKITLFNQKINHR